MQKLLCCLLIIFFSFIQHVNAQLPDDKIIPNDKLEWKYFTGKPDSSEYWAYTYWGVYYHYNVVSVHKDTVKIALQVTHVLKANSWVLPNKKSDDLLHHEQGHFNLAMLCEARFKEAIDTKTLLMPVILMK